MQQSLKELQNRIGYHFNNQELLKSAMMHSSYTNEKRFPKYKCNERLEFLGDAVLELVISDYLYKKREVDEGKMTKLRASYVCENALYEYSRDLNLSDYIKVGHGEEADGGRFKKVIQADIFEALMGAIYLDLGFDIVKKVILSIIVPYIEDPNISFFKDYKSVLQEYVQTEQRGLVYELENEEGPSHNKTFTIVVRIDNIIYGRGSAPSKKEAEQEAAKNALEKLAKVE